MHIIFLTRHIEFHFGTPLLPRQKTKSRLSAHVDILIGFKRVVYCFLEQHLSEPFNFTKTSSKVLFSINFLHLIAEFNPTGGYHFYSHGNFICKQDVLTLWILPNVQCYAVLLTLRKRFENK